MDLVLALLPWITTRLRINLKEKVSIAVAIVMGVSAAATAIIKSTSLIILNDEDFNYLGIEIVTRSIAEIATAIIAVSIPVLRTLICNLAHSHRGYHQPTSSDGDGIVNNRIPTPRTGDNAVREFTDMTDQIELEAGRGLADHVDGNGAMFRPPRFDNDPTIEIEGIQVHYNSKTDDEIEGDITERMRILGRLGRA
ncbi:hypothetical protein F4815DRAFT_444702 [Daldinia loculata]|nr:hypothetical protein F4815DRAFT_444702 [Daldinia loculata]